MKGYCSTSAPKSNEPGGAPHYYWDGGSSMGSVAAKTGGSDYKFPAIIDIHHQLGFCSSCQYESRSSRTSFNLGL